MLVSSHARGTFRRKQRQGKRYGRIGEIFTHVALETFFIITLVQLPPRHLLKILERDTSKFTKKKKKKNKSSINVFTTSESTVPKSWTEDRRETGGRKIEEEPIDRILNLGSIASTSY